MTNDPASDDMSSDGTTSDDLCEVHVTAPGADWLAEITRQLVTDRLAACGHIAGPIRSIYRWDGTVHDEAETKVALHTRRALTADIVAAVNAAHPYQVPGIFVLPLLDGSPAYDQWIRDQTAPAPRHGTGTPVP